MTSQDVLTVTAASSSCAPVISTNFGSEPLTVTKATVLGIAEGISELLLDSVNTGSQTGTDSPKKPHRKRKNEALYHKLLQGS